MQGHQGPAFLVYFNHKSSVNFTYSHCGGVSREKDNLDGVRQLKCWSGQFYFSLIRLVFINRPFFN